MKTIPVVKVDVDEAVSPEDVALSERGQQTVASRRVSTSDTYIQYRWFACLFRQLIFVRL